MSSWKTTREYTNKLMDLMDDGSLDPRTVADMCLQYMSESEVEDMCHANDILQDGDVEDENAEDQD
jgi:hypothetical protein